MRWAPVLVIVAACGGDSFSLDVQKPCPSCGTGHVLAAATTDVGVTFQVDGSRVAAYEGQHIEWIDTTLSVTASADASASADNLLSGFEVDGVASTADGHAYAIVSAPNNDAIGSTEDVIGLDGGHQTWSQGAVSDNHVPPAWIYTSPAGDAIVVADTSSGSAFTLDGTNFTGYIEVATLAQADGSLKLSTPHPATSTAVTATASIAAGGQVVSGTVNGSIQLGGTAGMLQGTAAGRTLFVARLDDGGGGIWGKTWIGGGPVYMNAVVSDGSRIIATGTFATTLDLGDGTVLMGADESDEFVVAMDGNGVTQWTMVLPGTIGFPTIALTPEGVMFGGTYFDATTIGSLSVPATVNGEGGLCAELVGGAAKWALTAVGNGDHTCTAVGTVAGHTYVMIDARDGVNGTTTTFDSLSTSGDMRMIVELGTVAAGS